MLSCGINFSNDKIKNRFINHLELFKKCEAEAPEVPVDVNEESYRELNSENEVNDDSDSFGSNEETPLLSANLDKEAGQEEPLEEIVEDYYNVRVDQFIEVIKNE